MFGQVGHLSHEPGVDGDEERIDHHLDRALGHRRVEDRRRAEEHDDAGGASVDGTLQGHVVDDAAVDVALAVDLDGRKDGRHGRRGQDGLDGGTVGEPPLASVGHRCGHHLDGYDGLFEALVGEPPLDDRSQTRVGEDRVALLQVQPRTVQPTLGVDVLAPQPQPHLGHLLHALSGRIGGEADPVDGPD